MKIREGFVSNSSASSFCILGISMGGDKGYDRDEYDEYDEKAKSVGLEVNSCPGDYNDIVIGISATKLPMDKTLNEMVKIISEKLKMVGIKFDKVDWHEQAWYDS